MREAPHRIHIKPTHPQSDDLDWYVWSDGTPYILTAPAALATSPEVQALIREAEARGMKRMKPVLIAYEELLATVQGECSALLDPCRGGSDLLANLIIQANITIQEQNDD